MEKGFELIKLANESIKTTDIKGKDYAEVNQRVKAFRMVHPLGAITTDIVSLENGVVTMKTTITNEDGLVLATGYAQEKESSSFINKTSFIENCETSSVGRALGMCGFGIDTSICSAEELQNALASQLDNKLIEKCKSLKIELEKLATYLKKEVSALTNEDLQKAVSQKEGVIKNARVQQ